MINHKNLNMYYSPFDIKYMLICFIFFLKKYLIMHIFEVNLLIKVII